MSKNIPKIEFRMATSQKDMMSVAAIRGICNLEGNGVPAQHEFDDNDSCATHFLGFQDGEPISTVRLRYFGEFIKLERACIRPSYRSRHVLPAAIDAVKIFAGTKGFRRVVTHAKPQIARLWRMLGFTIADKAPALFHGHDEGYLELWLDIPPRNDSVSLDTSAVVLFRQEKDLAIPNEYEIAA